MNNTERLIDAKDFKISLLMDELDFASDQYNYNLAMHLEQCQYLIGTRPFPICLGPSQQRIVSPSYVKRK